MPNEVLITPMNSPNDYYPPSCVTDAQKQEWSHRQIALGIDLPAPHRLPEGSLLQQESIRRREAAR